MNNRFFPLLEGVVRWVCVWAAAWGLAVSGWAADGDAVTQAMREALYAEEVTGDVAGALKAYEAVTSRFEEQRDLAADGWTALHSAATIGQARWVKATVTAGVNVNAATEAGLTPLRLPQTGARGYGAGASLLHLPATSSTSHRW